MRCHVCDRERELATLPLRERLHLEEGWRVAHAYDTALPGWLVLLPRRHVESLRELTDAKALRLGPLLCELTRALEQVTGCRKTYVMLFAEAEGYAHLHSHVVPRMPDQAPEHRGPGVIALLGASEADAVPPDKRERLAEALGAALA